LRFGGKVHYYVINYDSEESHHASLDALAMYVQPDKAALEKPSQVMLEQRKRKSNL